MGLFGCRFTSLAHAGRSCVLESVPAKTFAEQWGCETPRLRHDEPVTSGSADLDATWRARHPGLFADQTLDFAGVGYGHLSLRFTLDAKPDDMVSNVRVIGLNQKRVLVCTNDLGWRFLPGGTREPNEDVQHTAERELLEEAGSVVAPVMMSSAAAMVTTDFMATVAPTR